MRFRGLLGLLILICSLPGHAQRASVPARRGAAPAAAPPVEKLIQDSVVRACDRLNNRRTACNQPRAEAPALLPPPAQRRCDPRRRDAPDSQSVANSTGREFDVSVITPEEARQVFDYIRPQRTRYALDGAYVANRVCAQRAQMVAFDLLDVCKMKTAKIFVQPSRSRLALGLWRNNLHVETNGQSFVWDKYHVANVIYVRENGRVEPYVIDPLLFQEPVPMATWENLLKRTDGRASSYLTSSSAYTVSDVGSDDPSRALATGQAERDLASARRDARKITGP